MKRRRDYGSRRAVPHLRHLLGKRLRALREERGLSQQALGQTAGLTGKFVGEVERGEKSCSIDSLYRMARVLRVPMATLVQDGRPAPANPASERLVALVSRLRKPEEIRKARGVLTAMLGRG